jgi:hypothetical protein
VFARCHNETSADTEHGKGCWSLLVWSAAQVAYVACHGGSWLLGKFLLDRRHSSDDGCAHICTHRTILRFNTFYRIHIKKIFIRMSFGGVKLHSSALSYFCFDTADVHIVSAILGCMALLLISVPFRCRGLKVLVDLLDEDYTKQIDLVVHALNGIGGVFELQSPTTKKDFCQLFIQEGLLDPLSSVLLYVMGNQGPTSVEMKQKIIQILLVLSQVSKCLSQTSTYGTRWVHERSSDVSNSS